MHAAALAAHQLQRVGFFFCGIRLLPVAAAIGQLEETEFLGGEENEVLGDAAQMHHARAPRRGGTMRRNRDRR